MARGAGGEGDQSLGACCDQGVLGLLGCSTGAPTRVRSWAEPGGEGPG